MDTLSQLLTLPTPAPQMHVVVEYLARSADAPSDGFSSWLAANAVNAFVGLATLFLGLVAWATIIANDVAQQERLLPLCEMFNVIPVITRSSGGDWSVDFEFELGNDGGGPAKDLRLTLHQFAGEVPEANVNYLGSISPGARRSESQPYALPIHGGKDYEESDSYIVSLSYGWLRSGRGETYFFEHFKTDDIAPDRSRARITLPQVVPNGPRWLLWFMRRIGMTVG